MNDESEKDKMQFSVRLKKGVHPLVIEFTNKQTNFTDTVLYLIEKEIAENGVRNLQEHIPAVRNFLDSRAKDN